MGDDAHQRTRMNETETQPQAAQTQSDGTSETQAAEAGQETRVDQAAEAGQGSEKQRSFLDRFVQAARDEAEAEAAANAASENNGDATAANHPFRLRKRDIFKFHSKRVALFCIQLAFLGGVCYLGSAVSNHLPISIPANICSMVILLSLLITGMVDDSKIELASNFLLKYMPLFFIPAGVTILTSLPLIGARIPLFLLVCIITTVLVFLSTAVTVIVVGRVQNYLVAKRAGENVHLRSVFSKEAK